MTMRSNALAGVTASILLLTGVALVGCSDQTKEAASNTLNSAAQDTQNHVVAADQAVKETGHEVKQAGHDAAVATKDAAHNAAVATKDAAVATGTPSRKRVITSAKPSAVR
jgi:outer membrane murein-binding lipoprotein Lpp